MKLPETLEGVPFEYVQGMKFQDGAERIYQNRQYNLQVNVCTPRKRGVWGKGERSFSIIGSGKFFDSYEELRKSAKAGAA